MHPAAHPGALNAPSAQGYASSNFTGLRLHLTTPKQNPESGGAMGVQARDARASTNGAAPSVDSAMTAAFEFLPLAMLLVDAEARVLWSNAAAQTLLGPALSELQGQSFLGLMNEDERVRASEKQRTVVSAGKPGAVVFDAKLVPALGSVRCEWTLASVSPGVFTCSLRPGSTSGWSADVGHMEARYRTLASNLPHATVMLFDRSHRFFHVEGTALLEGMGLSRSDVEGKRPADFAINRERGEMYEAMCTSALAGETRTVTVDRNGFMVEIHTTPIIDRDGVISSGFVLMYDVTRRVESEKLLREKTMLLDSVIAGMSDGLIVVDKSGAPLVVNEAAVWMGTKAAVGAPLAEWPSVLSLFHEDRRTLIAEHPLSLALRGESVDQALVYMHPPSVDEGRWFSLSASPLLATDGSVRGAICIARDVSVQKRAEFEVRERSTFVQLLQRIAVEANRAASAAEAMGACLQHVCSHTGFPVGHLLWLDEKTDRLSGSSVWQLDEDPRLGVFVKASDSMTFGRGEGIPGRVLESGHARWMENLSAGSGFLRITAARDAGLLAGFSFPVWVGDKVVAVLEFFSRHAEAPSPLFLEVMTDIGMMLGRVVERERHSMAVESLSVMDELTGLYNRRGFVTLAAQSIKVADRARKPHTLLFLDLDGLKGINDTLGHRAGDEAIVAAANVLRITFRAADILGRLGGDELVVWAELDEAGLPIVLDRLKNETAKVNESGKHPFQLAMSVGESIYTPRSDVSIEELLAKADAAMYRQKSARKRALAASPVVESESGARPMLENTEVHKLIRLAEELAVASDGDAVVAAVMSSLPGMFRGVHLSKGTEDGRLDSVTNETVEHPAVDDARRMPPDVGTPSRDALRKREPVFLPSPAAIDRNYPHLADSRHRLGDASWAAFPLIFDGEVWGAVTFRFDAPQTFDAYAREMLEAISQQVTETLQRVVASQ